MTRYFLFFCVFSVALMSTSVKAAGTVTVSLSSAQNSATLAPGQLVQWRIESEVSSGDNAGLALILVDLEQWILNPAFIDIPLADGVPLEMSGFEAPAGFANNPTGYLGLRVGAVGARNLEQIGGAQNTFGVTGDVLGQDVNVEAGIGQNGPQLIAEGSFSAPFTAGTYLISLGQALANTLVSVNDPPMPSPTESAIVVFSSSSFSFVVDPTLTVAGDLNCDGVVNSADASAFALAVVSLTDYQTTYPDCDETEGDVNDDGQLDGRDIQGFVACLLAGGCP